MARNTNNGNKRPRFRCSRDQLTDKLHFEQFRHLIIFVKMIVVSMILSMLIELDQTEINDDGGDDGDDDNNKINNNNHEDDNR